MQQDIKELKEMLMSFVFLADSILKKEFSWCWNNLPKENRVTIPGRGKYPDATFDGFFVKNCTIISTDVVNTGEASDHRAVGMLVSIP